MIGSTQRELPDDENNNRFHVKWTKLDREIKQKVNVPIKTKKKKDTDF